VGQSADREPYLALTCPFRYNSARLGTAGYTSFFPVLPRAATVGPRLGASSAASEREVRSTGPGTQPGGDGPRTGHLRPDANGWLASRQTDTGRGGLCPTSLGRDLFGATPGSGLRPGPAWPRRFPLSAKGCRACASCPLSAVAGPRSSTRQRAPLGTCGGRKLEGRLDTKLHGAVGALGATTSGYLLHHAIRQFTCAALRQAASVL
jgi:hypothetical protein